MSTLRYSYDSESDFGYIRIGDGDVARTESLTASLVSARLQELVSTSPRGSRQEGPTVNSGLPAAGTTGNTQVA